MHLTGLPLATLIQIGALAGAAVVVFYILKLRRRPVAVPFSKIWTRILRDKEATSLFSQLKRLLSLLLQLALLALLLLALGDPRAAQNLIEGRNIVVLIDASASMSATDVAPSRLEAARERVRTMVRGLSGTDRMLIAQMDAAATPLSTLTGEISELEAALTRVAPTDAAADFPRALRFATDSLRGLPSPEVIVVSDGALGEAADSAGPVHVGDVKLSYVEIGNLERNWNAAITSFSVRRYPLDKSRYEVMLEVTNTGDKPMDVELSLLGDGQLNDLTRLRLAPHERLPRFYPNLSGASKTLEAKLAMADGTRDDLPADDHAYALLPERRRARVQVVTTGNMFLEAALLLDEYLDVTLVKPGGYPAKGAFDVTIFDNVAPVVTPGSGGVLYLNPTGTDVPFEVGKLIENDDKLGFDEIDAKSPLLRYTSLSDVNIARGHVLKGTKEDKVVAQTFNKGALLLQGRRAGAKFVALGFDVRESDFPMRIAWPLFLLNTINDFVEEDVSYISSFRTGTVWNVPVASSADSATLTLPGGEKRSVPVKDGRAVFLGQLAGFYSIATGAPGAEETSMFAANLSDPLESTIAPHDKLEVDGRVAGEVGEFKIGVRREMWVYLLAAVLLVTTLEWLTFHRRITV